MQARYLQSVRYVLFIIHNHICKKFIICWFFPIGVQLVNNDFVYRKLGTEMQCQRKISSHNLLHQTSPNMKRCVFSFFYFYLFIYKNSSHSYVHFQDSFVVGSDEEVDSDCTEFSSENELSDFDEITIAETRPNKRKLDEIKSAEVKKRRRIIEMSSDSD